MKSFARPLRHLARMAVEGVRGSANPELRPFQAIRRETHGYLAAEVYLTLYRTALTAPDGMMIDIGPAQGGSTICIGLGLRDSGREGPVYTIERFRNSGALRSWDNQDLNVQVLRDNLARHDLSEQIVVLVGGVEEVYDQVPTERPVGLLFIDADGALDRDFRLFFNRLADGAAIIVDDYHDVINRHARETYLKWTSRQEMARYVANKGAERFRDLCPLGKEYTTFRFLNHFLAEGLIERVDQIEKTVFARKAKGARFDPVRHGGQLAEIRDAIEATYYEMRGGAFPD